MAFRDTKFNRTQLTIEHYTYLLFHFALKSQNTNITHRHPIHEHTGTRTKAKIQPKKQNWIATRHASNNNEQQRNRHRLFQRRHRLRNRIWISSILLFHYEIWYDSIQYIHFSFHSHWPNLLLVSSSTIYYYSSLSWFLFCSGVCVCVRMRVDV